jgi:hypothetical protein
MIDLAFGFFALSWVPWTLSGLLIAGALAIWLDFRRRLRPVLDGLEDALRVVEEAPSASALHDRFSSINQRLSSNPVIGEAWRAFVGTLVPVPGQDGVLGATRRPREDLNESILTSAGGSIPRCPTTWSGSACCSPSWAWSPHCTSPAPGSSRPAFRRLRTRCATFWPPRPSSS